MIIYANFLPKSLSLRLKLLTLLWLIVACVSITLTLLLSWRLEGSAAAINDAGKLRMQTYRLSLAINNHTAFDQIKHLIDHFDNTLNVLKEGDASRPLFLPNTQSVRKKMATLQMHWQHEMRQLLLTSAQQKQEINIQDLQQFIQTIDNLTSAVEVVSANYIKWLRFFQMALLLMVLISAAVTIMLLYRWIIQPLQKLQAGVQAVHDGKFGVEVPLSDSTEFAQVDSGFNQMSIRLQQLYHGLEQEVNDKTRDLVKKNQTLETLYFFSRFLNQTQTITEAAEGFLQKIMTIVPAQAGSIRLIDLQRQRLDLVAHHGLPENLQNAQACQRLDDCLCGKSVQDNDWQTISFYRNAITTNNDLTYCSSLGFRYLKVVKIGYNGQDLGMMTLYFQNEIPSEYNHELLEALCSQIGVAFANIRLVGESKQLAVLQERNLMAQGLHDSIAQTLTFLNLQVQMLENAFLADERIQVQENLNFIKEGVQECYEDVRELLLNFRTKVSRKEFPEAIQTLTQRFEQQTHVAVSVRWQGDGPPLSSEQQLQFIFILQESLSNIRKHAQAHHVMIEFNNHQDFIMSIMDNGRGFDTDRLEFLTSNHVGLGIMRERAQRIRAKLTIESCPERYTRIILCLPQAERILE